MKIRDYRLLIKLDHTHMVHNVGKVCKTELLNAVSSRK